MRNSEFSLANKKDEEVKTDGESNRQSIKRTKTLKTGGSKRNTMRVIKSKSKTMALSPS